MNIWLATNLCSVSIKHSFSLCCYLLYWLKKTSYFWILSSCSNCTALLLFFSSLYNLKSLSDILIHRDVQAPWQQKKSWLFSCIMKVRPETISVPENVQAKPVPFLRSVTKQPSRKCRIATELTLTAAATVGGWWRSGGVEEEEVMNSPSGTKWIIQLYSTKTPTGAGIVCTIPSAVNNMTNSITPWNGEHAPTPLWFLLLICTIPCLRGIIHHLLFRLSFLSFHVCLKHHMLSLE